MGIPKQKLDQLEGEVLRRYAAMPPAERLARHLAALAGDDPGEAARLRQSCPWKEYRQADAAYSDRLEYANFMAVAAASDLRHASGKLAVFRLLLDELERLTDAHGDAAFRAFLDGWGAAGGTLPEADDGGDDEDAKLPQPFRDGWAATEGRVDAAQAELRELFGGVAGSVAAVLKAHWRGLDRFCRTRLGSTAETLVRAWGGPVADEVLDHVHAFAEAEADPAHEARCFDILARELVAGPELPARAAAYADAPGKPFRPLRGTRPAAASTRANAPGQARGRGHGIGRGALRQRPLGSPRPPPSPGRGRPVLRGRVRRVAAEAWWAAREPGADVVRPRAGAAIASCCPGPFGHSRWTRQWGGAC